MTSHSPQLEKRAAGFMDALRTALTGRVPVYHGTAKRLLPAIKSQGVKPQGSPGISGMVGDLANMEKGISFTTRSAGEAGNYAMQAAGIDRANRWLPKLLPLAERAKGIPFVGDAIKGFSSAAKQDPQVAKGLRLAFARHVAGPLPGNKAVVKANIPRGTLRNIEAHVPEAVKGPAAEMGKLPDWVLGSVFARTMPVFGPVNPKYIVGSKSYQGVTPKELLSHFQSIKENPTEYLKDVGRSFLGVSHRPSNVIRRARAGEGLPPSLADRHAEFMKQFEKQVAPTNESPLEAALKRIGPQP